MGKSHNFYSAVFGQILSLFFALYQIVLSKVDLTWNFYISGPLYFLLFLVNEIVILVLRRKVKRPRTYKIILCALSTVIINILFIKVSGLVSPYIIIFISQLSFPLGVLYKLVIKKENENLSFYRFLLFFLIIVSSFFLNWKINNSNTKISLKGIIYTIIANFLLVYNGNLLYDVVNETCTLAYNRYMSILAIPISLMLNFIVDYDILVSNFKVYTFYKENYKHLCVYYILIMGVYFFVPIYTKKFTYISFQSSSLSKNCYTGFISLVHRDNKKFMLFCLLVTLFSSFILTYTTKIQSNK